MSKVRGFLMATMVLSAVTFAQDCRSPTDLPGQCISIYDCPTIIRLIQAVPLRPIDKEFIRKSQCGSLGRGIPKVCCVADDLFLRSLLS